MEGPSGRRVKVKGRNWFSGFSVAYEVNSLSCLILPSRLHRAYDTRITYKTRTYHWRWHGG